MSAVYSKGLRSIWDICSMLYLYPPLDTFPNLLDLALPASMEEASPEQNPYDPSVGTHLLVEVSPKTKKDTKSETKTYISQRQQPKPQTALSKKLIVVTKM